MYTKAIFLVALFFNTVSSATGNRQEETVALPDTPAGRVASAYLKAFNQDTEELLADFFSRYISNERLEQIPLEQRVKHTRQMRSQTGPLEVKRVLESRNDLLKILTRSNNDQWFTLEIQCAPDPPHHLLGMMIDTSEPEETESVRARNDVELLSSVKTYLDSLASAGQFSGVVLIAKNAVPLFQEAYGYADMDARIPNTIETKFNIGSINKTFTKLAIHQLAAQGKLSLNDPIKRYLPNYPNREAAEKVTVQHLLDMTSGIGDIFGDRYMKMPKERLRSIDDFLALFADLPLEFEPGTRRRYSNGGYVVLGAIIEAVVQSDYYTYVRERIFRIAGMNGTDWFEKETPLTKRAVGYTRGPEGELTRNDPSLPARGSSAGGGYSTAPDLLKFVKALGEQKFHAPGYEGNAGLGIAGGAPGVNAVLEWNPRNGYAIVIMSNYDPPSAEHVSRQIRSWLPEEQRQGKK